MQHRTSNRIAGFSLVELSIVLIIVALLSAGAITALRLQTERNRLLETRAQLNEAREALLNYAAVNGALPCPDSKDDQNSATTNDADGKPDACKPSGVTQGLLPWHLLGLPARDVWGQGLHYAVHYNFTNAGALKLSSTSGLEIYSKDNAANLTQLANEENVALALWSSGANATDDAKGDTDSKVVAESPDSDDVVIWLSRFVLLGRMLEAGRDIQ